MIASVTMNQEAETPRVFFDNPTLREDIAKLVIQAFTQHQTLAEPLTNRILIVGEQWLADPSLDLGEELHAAIAEVVLRGDFFADISGSITEKLAKSAEATLRQARE